MENLFNMEGLEKVSLDYKNEPCDNLDLEIIDAFYIYEYIIKNVLPELIKLNTKAKKITFAYMDKSRYQGVPNFEVHWLNSSNYKDISFLRLLLWNFDDRLKNKDLKINQKTFDLLVQMFRNFIDRYKLGPKVNTPDEFYLNVPQYQLVDAFYSEWQRIDYEAKSIIEDFQEEYNIDRKVLLPGESNISELKRKKINIKSINKSQKKIIAAKKESNGLHFLYLPTLETPSQKSVYLTKIITYVNIVRKTKGSISFYTDLARGYFNYV